MTSSNEALAHTATSADAAPGSQPGAARALRVAVRRRPARIPGAASCTAGT
ncbi:hypothetical protein ACFQ51_15930 [Streptomyces kaempferi]